MMAIQSDVLMRSLAPTRFKYCAKSSGSEYVRPRIKTLTIGFGSLVVGDPTYILDRDLADQAIAWMRMQHALAPTKPWLLYYATGTAHAPHHAPKDWIAKYKGQFGQGWDKVREETLARQIKLGVVPPLRQEKSWKGEWNVT